MNSNFMTLWGQAVHKSATIFFMTSLLILTSCGGGSSSTTSTENVLPSPVAGGIEGEELVPGAVGQNPMPPATLELLPQVSVGQRQFADPNVLLNLRGNVVAAEGSEIVKTLWTQVTGPQVIISSPLALENVILMPDVNVATQLEFRLTAEDSEGRVNSATVSVLIKPVPTFVKVVGGVFNEDDENAVFTVRLNAPSTLPISISYITQDGTATSEGDYTFTSGEITLAPGEDNAEILVALINDVEEEENESFSLQVTAVDGEVSRANTGVAIIRNGTEPKLPQAITFTDSGPVPLFPGQEYTNVLTSQPPGTGDIIYSSSNSSVASVDAQGKVVALATGNAQITATKPSDDVYLSATNSYSVQVGSRAQTIQFTSLGPVEIFFKSVFSNPINPAITSPGTGGLVYASSKPEVATVDNQGKITVVSLGTTTISAVKSADSIYSSAAASYELRVIGTGVAPVVSFSQQSSAAYRDGTSVGMGQTVTFVGLAQDAEDGALPTAGQLAVNRITGLPITSLTWSSSLDGFLGNGDTFSTNNLSMGTHRIIYSATDSDGNIGSASIRVLVGNVSPLATPTATSSTSGYAPFRMTDSDLTLTLGGEFSWSNADEVFVVGGPPRWTVYLDWELPVFINMVDLYTSAGAPAGGQGTYALRAYEIEYWDGANTWLPLVAVTGNTALYRSHPVTEVTTTRLRVITHGSTAQTTFSRINELVVFGTVDTSRLGVR